MHAFFTIYLLVQRTTRVFCNDVLNYCDFMTPSILCDSERRILVFDPFVDLKKFRCAFQKRKVLGSGVRVISHIHKEITRFWASDLTGLYNDSKAVHQRVRRGVRRIVRARKADRITTI